MHRDGRRRLAYRPVRGYEIHAGITEGADLARPLFQLGDRPDGAQSEDGQVLGSYLHGLFDQPAACAALLAWAGHSAATGADDGNAIEQAQEHSFERLADAVEKHLDGALLRRYLIDQAVDLSP